MLNSLLLGVGWGQEGWEQSLFQEGSEQSRHFTCFKFPGVAMKDRACWVEERGEKQHFDSLE